MKVFNKELHNILDGDKCCGKDKKGDDNTCTVWGLTILYRVKKGLVFKVKLN